jgi:hypothetical protein
MAIFWESSTDYPHLEVRETSYWPLSLLLTVSKVLKSYSKEAPPNS